MDSSELIRQYDFSGQTIVITGGTGTLGGEIACALVGCGANVAILDRNLDPAHHILELMEPRANQAVAVRADVLNGESLQEASKIILEKFGVVHSLVNAAGGNNPRATTTKDLSFFDLPSDALRWVFDLNLLGTMLACQVFGKAMAEKGEGMILNISSMNAFRPLTQFPPIRRLTPESATTQWLAVHMARFIRRAFASMPLRRVSS